MDGGTLIVDGAAGDYVGAGMRGGEITVRGDARVWPPARWPAAR